MKLKSLLLLALAAALGLAAPRAALARSENISFEFFYDSLAPYGEWVQVGDYGLCWRPAGVDADWTPYSDGYWSYTDAGWTWVSYEDFGGIVYHYGRWVSAEDEGWCWVPDYDWGPAWVSWRSNEKVVGWAPLPPEAHFQRDTGFSVWTDSAYDIGPGHYNFCNLHDFGEPVLRPVLIDRGENVTIIQNTVNVTNISFHERRGFGDGLIFCGGPSYYAVNRYVNRPIPTLKLVQNTNITNIHANQVNIFNSVQRGNQLTVFAPTAVRPTTPFARTKPARIIPEAKVNKGWAVVKDAAVEKQVRAKIKQEAKGLTPQTAPAKVVQAAELKAVPVKADPNAPSPVKTAKGRILPPGKQADKPVATTDKPAKGAPTPVVVNPLDPTGKTTQEKGHKGKDKPEIEKAATGAPSPVVVNPLDPAAKAAQEKGHKGKDKPPIATAPVVPVEEPAKVVGPKNPIVTVPEKKGKPQQTEGSARERAIAQQREQAAALEAAKKQRIEAAKQQHSAQVERQQQMEAARKQQVPDPNKTQAAEAAHTQQSNAAARQHALDAARKGQVEEAAKTQQQDAARRQHSVDAAKTQQVEAARAQQGAQTARQQQSIDAARKQQVMEAARAQQGEAARRQQSIDAARSQQIEAARARQQPPPQTRQVQPQPQPNRQVQPQPQPNQQAPARTAGKRQLTVEEIEALKKKQQGR